MDLLYGFGIPFGRRNEHTAQLGYILHQCDTGFGIFRKVVSGFGIELPVLSVAAIRAALFQAIGAKPTDEPIRTVFYRAGYHKGLFPERH